LILSCYSSFKISAHFISTFRNFLIFCYTFLTELYQGKLCWLSNIGLFTVFIMIILCALKKKFRTHVIKLDIAPKSFPPGQYLLVSARDLWFLPPTTCFTISVNEIKFAQLVLLTQQVLNGQIGSLKSSEFQKKFSQGKH
jgi:hypothetical protein